jgi:hypothetical protein
LDPVAFAIGEPAMGEETCRKCSTDSPSDGS